MLNILRKEYINDSNHYYKETANVTGKELYLVKIRDNVNSSFHIKIKERREEIVIYRLRLGHVGVNKYLHRFNMSITENCNYCQAPETIEHLLLACGKYQE